MNHFIVDGKYKDLLQGAGLDVTEILRKAGLPEDILNHKTITMQEEQYYRFMQAIGDSMQDDKAMIALATGDQIEAFSPPIFAAWCSRNGLVCIQRLAAYKKLIGPLTWTLKQDEDTETVLIEPGDSSLTVPPYLVQSDMAFLIGMIRKATKEEIVPAKITLMEVTGDALSDYAGVTVTKGNENSITFTGSDLNKPFVSFNPAMWDYFEPEMNKRLGDLDVDDSMAARVRSALSELLPSGACSIEDVAGKLGLSKRTLQRKLSEEKTTFQKQLNSARETLAIHYVRNTDMSTADMAYLLGYAELNSFLRAFTVWTGKSISAYRQDLLN